MKFNRITELVDLAEQCNKPVGEVVADFEAERSGRPAAEIKAQMQASLSIMRQAVAEGIKSTEKSLSGLVGTDAVKLAQYISSPQNIVGEVAVKAAAYALAVNEVNARMGKIVACPTAGSCGIVPGAVLAVADGFACSEDLLVRAMFTASGIGLVIAQNASVSGAFGGCQAECGSAAAMAAGAVVEMMGGTPAQVSQGAALALKNLLGLVCDPVAGLVEVPCVKRNAFCTVHALLAAQMALAGICSAIPTDEVIDAMAQIGQALPASLKETSEGGLAKTLTGLEIARRLEGKGTCG